MLRDYFTQDLFTIFCLVNLILVVVVRQRYSFRFSDYLQVVWNVKYFKLYSKEKKRIDGFNSILFLNFLIAIGLFSHIGYSYFFNVLPNDLFTFLKLFGALGALLIIKIVVEYFISSSFEISEFIRLYIFQKMSFRNYTGFVFIGINFLLLFTAINKTLLIFLGLILYIFITIIGLVRFFRRFQKTILSYSFYFLLYLCALEIGPYIILYKAFKDYFG